MGNKPSVKVNNNQVMVSLHWIVNRIRSLKPIESKTEYWKGYEDALKHTDLMIKRMIYKQNRLLAESVKSDIMKVYEEPISEEVGADNLERIRGLL